MLIPTNQKTAEDPIKIIGYQGDMPIKFTFSALSLIESSLEKYCYVRYELKQLTKSE